MYLRHNSSKGSLQKCKIYLCMYIASNLPHNINSAIDPKKYRRGSNFDIQNVFQYYENSQLRE